MESDPEYYKKQADINKERYEKIEAKKKRTTDDNNRIRQLKIQEATYRNMYARAITQKEQLQKIQRILQERQAEPPKKNKLISMLKANEARKKQQEQERLREQQEQKRLREQQERMDKSLQRGIPTNEDVREDAAKLGINIDEDLDDKNIEDELAELGGPDNFPNVPSHSIEIGKKPNIENPSVSSNVPPPHPPITDDNDLTAMPMSAAPLVDDAAPLDDDYEKENDITPNTPIQSTVQTSVKAPLSSPTLNADNKSRQDSSTISTSSSQQPPIPSISSNQTEVINLPTPPISKTSNYSPFSIFKRPSNSKNDKTRKNRDITQEIEMKTLPKTRKNYPSGFRETLKNKTEKRIPRHRIGTNICKDIITEGSKVTKKYFYPSEFPKLTKINVITIRMMKGGKPNKKSRKLIKKRKC